MARRVPSQPALPRTSTPTLQNLYHYDNDLNKALFTYLTDLALRANDSLQVTGDEPMEGDLDLGGFDLINAGGIFAGTGTFTDLVTITRALTPQLQITRSGTTINTNIQLVNDSGSVYIGHGSANTFVAGNSANLASAGNQFIAASASGLSVLGGAAVNALAGSEYTPSLTNSTNIDSTTPLNSNYMRVGNQVIVHGSMVIDATAGGGALTTVGISLPVASNFTGTVDANGVMTSQSGVSGRIIANVANDRADMHYLSSTTSAATYYYSFMYTVK